MIGVKYSLATGRVRCIIHPDNVAELSNVPLSQGEGLLKLPKDGPINLLAIQEIVNKHTGKTPQGDTYAVVDKAGKIVTAVIADPLCGDFVHGHDLVQHNDAAKLVGTKL